MNQPIKSILSQPYHRKSWEDFLHNKLGAVISPINIAVDDFNKKIVKSSFVLGSITINHQIIEIYEITIADNIALERNRVGLYQQIWRKRRTASAFLVVFTKKESKKWRVSYVSENIICNEAGEITSYSTTSKRFTFLLGEGEVTRTAEERFSALMANPARTLDSWKECFSVEKISKEFFAQYKSHYQQFCNAIINTPSQRTAIFNNEDKAIRDFCKKLLGRIVFLYFLQKKGWLLESADKEWGEGNPNFLTTLFNNFPNKESFYSNCLTTLFFDTLNKPRNGDEISLIRGQKYKIPYLNGGLFEEDGKDETQRENLRNINFPAKLFHALFEFLDAYNFTIYEDDPEEQTIAVDPEMLGHIFENLLEDNKDKGAFYTPKEIVQYMARESLIEYLVTWFAGKEYEIITEKDFSFDRSCQQSLIENTDVIKTKIKSREKKTINRQWIENLLQNQLDEANNQFVKAHANEINQALDEVKICDPAIGSGAFPMGLLHEIFHAKQNIHIINHGDLAGFDSAKVKRDIIQNSIYGVDIEAGAVDIARLRFWLSLVVDEKNPHPLPNLDYKIVVGNSLVSIYEGHIINIDWQINNNLNQDELFTDNASLRRKKEALLENLVQNQKDYFQANNVAKKKLESRIRNSKIEIIINQLLLMRINLAKEITGLGNGRGAQNKINALKLQDEFYSETIKNLKSKLKTPNAKLHFFDWALNFPEILNPRLIPEPEKRGFNIVIGNPPYVSAPSMVSNNAEMRNQIIDSNQYSTLYNKWDLYIPFMELGLTLLVDNGLFTMIVPYPLTNQNYAMKLRELIINQFNMIELVDLNGTKIFESATVSNCIPFITKSNPKQSCYISKFNEEGKIKREFIQTINDLVQDKNTLVWNLSTDKREGNSHSEMNVLGDYCYISVGMVLNADEKTAKGNFVKDDLISNTFDSIHCRKYIEAKDIERYKVKKVRYLEYNTKRCPDMLRRPTFRELYEKPKLMFNRLGGLMVYMDNKTKFLHSDSMYSSVLWKDLDGVDNKSISASIKRYSNYPRSKMVEFSENIDLRYLLGILNSKYATILLSNLRGGDYHIYPEHIRNIPIPKISSKEQKPIIELVDKILAGKKTNQDTKPLEQQIDNLVYKLYGLTYEEVKIIQPDFPLSPEEYLTTDEH